MSDSFQTDSVKLQQIHFTKLQKNTKTVKKTNKKTPQNIASLQSKLIKLQDC